MTAPIRPGEPFPLGASATVEGANVAVASGGEAVDPCLLDAAGGETRITLPGYDAGVWYGFVPGVGPGQAYGYRVSGPWDPARGLRYNPAKLLLDPYARAIDGYLQERGSPGSTRARRRASSPAVQGLIAETVQRLDALDARRDLLRHQFKAPAAARNESGRGVD